MNTKERNYSIDILRIISMLMIVCLHYLKYANTMDDVCRFSTVWFGVYSIRAICFVCVNVYVLISAYFLSGSDKVSMKKLIGLWGQMFFYSVIISIVLFMSNNALVTGRNVIYSMFPFITKQYWFVNAYIAMYLFHPFANQIIRSCDKKQAGFLITILVALFSVPQSIIPMLEWTLDDTQGYGIIWFLCLYLIGGFIKKFELDIKEKFKDSQLLVIYFGCSVVTVLFRIIILKIATMIGHENFLEGFASRQEAYNSIPVLIASLALFLWFLKRKWEFSKITNRFIKNIALATFGVYLIHQHFLIKVILWHDLLNMEQKICTFDVFRYLWIVFLVFIACTILDLIRHWIVDKLKLNRLMFLENWKIFFKS